MAAIVLNKCLDLRRNCPFRTGTLFPTKTIQWFNPEGSHITYIASMEIMMASCEDMNRSVIVAVLPE